MYNLTLFTVEQTSGQINRILSKIKTCCVITDWPDRGRRWTCCVLYNEPVRILSQRTPTAAGRTPTRSSCCPWPPEGCPSAGRSLTGWRTPPAGLRGIKHLNVLKLHLRYSTDHWPLPVQMCTCMQIILHVTFHFFFLSLLHKWIKTELNLNFNRCHVFFLRGLRYYKIFDCK